MHSKTSFLSSILIPLFLSLLQGCGGQEDPGDGQAQGSSGEMGSQVGQPLDEAELADTLLRERAAAAASVDDWDGAFSALLPLVQREDPSLDDIVGVGQTLAELGRHAESREYFERAAQLAPDDLRIAWGLFEIAFDEGLYEEALPLVQRVVSLAPDDYRSLLALANTYAVLEQHDQARPIYEKLIKRGIEAGSSWYATTVYRYHWNLIFSDLDDEDGRWLDEFTRLMEEGITAPTETQIRRGSYGELAVPQAGEYAVDQALRLRSLGDGGASTKFIADDPLVAGGVSGLFPVRIADADLGTRADAGEHVIDPAPLSVVLFGQGGLRLARRSPTGNWESEQLLPEPVSIAVPLDVDSLKTRGGSRRDALMDLVASTQKGLVLLRQTYTADGEQSWGLWDVPLLGPEFPVADLTAVDFDHEGDLDLLVVGPKGVRLLRNDGVPAQGAAFVDVTEKANLPTTGDYSWCTIDDLDVDNDVDLLFGGEAGVFLAHNERGGNFSDASASLPSGLTGKPSFVDVDRDGRPDLVDGAVNPVRIFGNGFGDRWKLLDEKNLKENSASGAAALLSDLGDVDRLRGIRVGPDALTPFQLRPLEEDSGINPGLEHPRQVALGDVSGDGVDDLIVSDGETLDALIAQSDDHVVRLELMGIKDNRRGVGAIVELRAGPLYQRWYWDGRPRSFSVGSAPQMDVVRVTWPNGVVQTVTDLKAPAAYVIKQREGLIGSCPFLYTWNGNTFEFISDVLGITPLGLPIDEGNVVPPDHDEFVLVRGDQLVPKDGFFEMQFTEELREVTYLDHIRLDVVDHPAQVEILPNERFTFPPFPEAHTHTIVEPLSPTRATDQEGRDWTAELAQPDQSLARTFEAHRGQYLGLAGLHYIELTFDPEAVRAASKLRLLMTGWLYWTDASVNMASSNHPQEAFVPPLLSVPDGEGGWQQVGPPLGFPAGKLKTMVVDVSAFVRPDDPRLRISSTLALYWDSIRLAVDDDDAEIQVTSIAPSSGELWERGFSEPIPLQGEAELDWFDWGTLASQPRWNQHPGLYTHFGEVLPLLEQVDDQYVIMGSGDALKVRFGADGLPPLREGWTRDYLVYLDGWAKDRDPNTKEALYVEPLPFHGMSGYPYGADESFPDTPAMRAWRKEWNTRPSKLLIKPLAGASN